MILKMYNRSFEIKKIRVKLRKGEVTLGTWMQIPSAAVAEIIGDAGYDWAAIDLEHGSMSTAQLPNIFRAIELGGTVPLVRLAIGNAKEAKDALDAGAGGIIIPMIESAKQLESIINDSSWPPNGRRGVGFSRANLYGKYFDTYSKEAQNPLIIAQIENIKAVDDIMDILNVKDLDAIIIGPYDLSASMGLTSQFNHPDYLNALKRIRNACLEKSIPLGIHIVSPDEKELKEKINDNYQFIAYSIDAVFLNNSIINPLN